MTPEALRHLDPLDARELEPGALHYRAFVGLPCLYDATAAMQFQLLASLGLREHHSLLDVGCGGLSAGRLFIPYLLAGNYCAIEPNEWLVEDAVRYELGPELVRMKRPRFLYRSDFPMSAFERKFDFILAQSILSHTSQAQLAHFLREAAQALAPKGVLVANFSPGPLYEGADWLYPEFATYPLAFLTGAAAGAGLTARPLTWTNHYDLTWMTFIHQQHAGDLSWIERSSDIQTGLRVLELSREVTELKSEIHDLEEKLSKP